jgi:hypothetical protein
MQNEPTDLTPAQRELERALRSLPAAHAPLDPVAAAFTAGRRSAERPLRLWRSAAALLLLTTIAPHALRTPPSTPGRGEGGYATVAPPRILQVATPATPSPHSLLMLQKSLHEHGIDGLPPSHLPAVRPTPASRTL